MSPVDILLIVGAFALILWGAESFTDGVDWFDTALCWPRPAFTDENVWTMSPGRSFWSESSGVCGHGLMPTKSHSRPVKKTRRCKSPKAR